MADVQHALLSQAILGGALPEIIASRITVDFFDDEQYARVYEYLINHWTKYAQTADEPVIKLAFPTMRWVLDSQPVEYHITQLQTRRRKTIMLEALNGSALLLQNAKDDPDHVDKIVRGLQDAVHRAETETSGREEVDATSLSEHRAFEALLKERKENVGDLRGITTGFKGIDHVTGGFQPEHFVVVFGLPKTFKSATLLAMASAAHMDAYVPMFVGFEMSQDEQRDRLTSLRSGVSLSKILTGDLSEPELRKVRRARSQLLDMRPFHFVSDADSAMDVAGIASLIVEKDPDLVFIDGIYFLNSALDPKNAEPGSPQALTDISRSLKRLAQRLKKPIIVSSQANQSRSKGGHLNLSSGMYSQAFVQDANIILGTERPNRKEGEEREDEDESGPVTINFKVLGSRSGPRKTTVLEWDWDKGRVRELVKKDMDKQLNSRAHPTPGTQDNAGWTR